MSWSQDPSTYRVVFLVGDAPPHMDYQDDVKYPQVVAAAAAKGIVVNTIQCGSMSETVAPWQHIASLGRGRYFTVEQAGSAVAIATPFDAQIATLAAELDGTRLYYGSAEERAAMAAKVAATDAAQRRSFGRRARAPRRVQRQRRRRRQFPRRARARRRRRERPRRPRRRAGRGAAARPSPRCRPREQRALLEETAEKREELKRQIAALAAERDAYIEAEVEAAGGAEGSLDQQIYDAVRSRRRRSASTTRTGRAFERNGRGRAHSV